MISEEEAEKRITHSGGGYYELSDGSVTEERGKDHAIKEEQKLANNKDPENVMLDNGVEIEVDLWNGYKNYHCPACPAADLDLERLKDHAINFHHEKELKARKTLDLDRYDRET